MEALSMSLGRHLEDDQAELYSMGEMSGEDIVYFEEHLLTCEDCRNRVLDADRYVSAMYRAGRKIRGPVKRRPAWSWTLAAASAVAMVFAAAFLIQSPRDSKFQETHLYAMRGA